MSARQWLSRTVAPVAARVDDDRSARVAGWLIWPLALVLFVSVGRHQWFARDDWALLFTRDAMHDILGTDDMLLAPQDGHWMTVPILIYRALHAIFGLGSYWPYLVTLWVTHVAIVLAVRAWMVRLGVSAWTTVLVTALMLVFGTGWENLVFAVQITYNLSIAAFLVQLLLVDHDGPLDWRDGLGSALALVAVTSSGFGPFFLFGVAVLMVLRRRWLAGVVAVVPAGVALGWWWLTWGADPAGEQKSASARFVINFTRVGLEGLFAGLTGDRLLAGAGLVGCAAVVVWPGLAAARRWPLVTLLVTAVVMYAGVGSRRATFGIAAGAWPRYAYMAAMLVAPVLAVAIDQLPRFAPWARWCGRFVLLFAVARNARWLQHGGDIWAANAAADRSVFELVAGSDARFDVAPDDSLTDFSPDVRLSNLAELVEDGAITPRTPTTDAEHQLVAAALAP